MRHSNDYFLIFQSFVFTMVSKSVTFNLSKLTFGPNIVDGGGSFLSNFFPYVSNEAKTESQKKWGINKNEGGFSIQGKNYKTVEHYLAFMRYKAMKDINYANKLMTYEDPENVKKYSELSRYLSTISGTEEKQKVTRAYKDFNKVRVEVLDRALAAKFSTNPTLRKALLSMKDITLETDEDNILAERLMNLRDRLLRKDVDNYEPQDEIIESDDDIEQPDDEKKEEIDVEAGNISYADYPDAQELEIPEDGFEELSDEEDVPPTESLENYLKRLGHQESKKSLSPSVGDEAKFVKKGKMLKGTIEKVYSNKYDIIVNGIIHTIEKDNKTLKITKKSDENDDIDEFAKDVEDELTDMPVEKRKKPKFDIADKIYFSIENSKKVGTVLSINKDADGKVLTYVISSNAKRFVVPADDSSLMKYKLFVPEIPIGTYVSVEDDDDEKRHYGRIEKATEEKYVIRIIGEEDWNGTLTIWSDDDTLQVENDPEFFKGLEPVADEEQKSRLDRMKKKFRAPKKGKRIIKKAYWEQRTEKDITTSSEPYDEKYSNIIDVLNAYGNNRSDIPSSRKMQSEGKVETLSKNHLVMKNEEIDGNRFRIYDYIQAIQNRQMYQGTAYGDDENWKRWPWKNIPVEQLRHQIGERILFTKGSSPIEKTGQIVDITNSEYEILVDNPDKEEKIMVDIKKVNILNHEDDDYYTFVTLLSPSSWKESIEGLFQGERPQTLDSFKDLLSERLQKLTELFESQRRTTQFMEIGLRTIIKDESKRVEGPIYNKMKIVNLSNGSFLKVPSSEMVVEPNLTTFSGLLSPPQYMREAMVTYLTDRFLNALVPSEFKKGTELAKFQSPISYDMYKIYRYNQWKFSQLQNDQKFNELISDEKLNAAAEIIFNSTSVPSLIASLKLSNPQFFLLSRDKIISYLSNKLRKSILEVIILDELLRNTVASEIDINITSTVSISGYDGDDPRVEYSLEYPNNEDAGERIRQNIEGEYVKNPAPYLKYKKKGNRKRVSFNPANKIHKVYSRQEVASEITNGIERYLRYYKSPSIENIKSMLKMKTMIYNFYNNYFSLEDRRNFYNSPEGIQVQRDYEEILENQKREFEESKITKVDKLKNKLEKIQNIYDIEKDKYANDVKELEDLKDEFDRTKNTNLLPKIKIMENIDSIQKLNEMKEKIDSIEKQISSEIEQESDDIEVSINNILRDQIRMKVSAYEDRIFMGYQIMTMSSANMLNASEYVKMAVTPLVFLKNKQAKYFMTQFMSGNIQIEDLASCQLEEYLPELFMNTELSADIIQKEKEKIMAAIEKQTSLFDEYISLIIGTVREPSRKKVELDIDEKLLVVPQEMCQNVNNLSTEDLVMDKTIVNGEPVFTCYSIAFVVKDLASGSVVSTQTGIPYSQAFLQKMRIRLKEKIDEYNS